MLLKVNQKLIFPFCCINILPLRAISSLSIDYDFWYSATSIRIGIWRMHCIAVLEALVSFFGQLVQASWRHVKSNKNAWQGNVTENFSSITFDLFFPLVGSAFMTYEYKFVKILIKTAWKLEITGFLVECHVFQLIFFPNKSAKFHSSSKRLQL